MIVTKVKRLLQGIAEPGRGADTHTKGESCVLSDLTTGETLAVVWTPCCQPSPQTHLQGDVTMKLEALGTPAAP